jgi:intracellular sulfur oxidation DsrE/DsrF family protein
MKGIATLISRRACLWALSFAMLGTVSQPSIAQARGHHVVFRLTSPDETDWKIMINNIHSLLTGFAPDGVDVEVVAFGPGISFLKNDTPELSDIKELEAAHVHFMACNNSMRAHHWTQTDIVPGAEIVPSGIVEVVKKEESGWSYIKAGR